MGVGSVTSTGTGSVAASTDTGSSSTPMGGDVAATAVNTMSDSQFSAGLAKASNSDLASIAGNSGVSADKRGQALSALLDHLGNNAPDAQKAAQAPKSDNVTDQLDEDKNEPASKMKKLLHKLMRGEKLTAAEQKDLGQMLSQMRGAQDTTAGGAGPNVPTGNHI
jgi:hypothetical protein